MAIVPLYIDGAKGGTVDITVSDYLPDLLIEQIDSDLNRWGASLMYGPNPSLKQLAAHYRFQRALQRLLNKHNELVHVTPTS